jgi:hypothetical protein
VQIRRHIGGQARSRRRAAHRLQAEVVQAALLQAVHAEVPEVEVVRHSASCEQRPRRRQVVAVAPGTRDRRRTHGRERRGHLHAGGGRGAVVPGNGRSERLRAASSLTGGGGEAISGGRGAADKHTGLETKFQSKMLAVIAWGGAPRWCQRLNADMKLVGEGEVGMDRNEGCSCPNAISNGTTNVQSLRRLREDGLLGSEKGGGEERSCSSTWACPGRAAGVTSLQPVIARVLSAAHRRPHHQSNACSLRNRTGPVCCSTHASARYGDACSHCPELRQHLI